MRTKTLLCAIISGPSLNDANLQIAKAEKEGADLLELRIDLLKEKDLANLTSCLPFIFTLRRDKDGGKFSEDAGHYLKKLKELSIFKPAYIDLDWQMGTLFLSESRRLFPKTKIILSYHNLDETPKDLDAILEALFETGMADIYKIAAKANSTLDALRLLLLHRKAEKLQIRLSSMAIGEKGTPTRILGPYFNTAITYACLDKPLLSGQLSLNELIGTYRFKEINAQTKIFALTGDPLHLSPSHITHNFCFKNLNENALYVKLPISKEEILGFKELLEKVPLAGLSVTMPLKEAFIENESPYNTFIFKKRSSLGTNTDGIGALDLLKEATDVKGKRLLLIGAGSTAYAIAKAAFKEKVSLIILNRDPLKAKALALECNAGFGGLNDFSKACRSGVDILVNASAIGMKEAFPIDYGAIPENIIVLDAVMKSDTLFIKEAKLKNCKVFTGFDLFIKQAAYQFAFFGIKESKKRIEQLLTESLHYENRDT